MHTRHGSEVDGEEAQDPSPPRSLRTQALHALRSARSSAASSSAQQGPKIGRNDPCPCRSGQKFKKCHGAALEDGTEPDEREPVEKGAL